MRKRMQRLVSAGLALTFALTSVLSVAAYHEDDTTIHDFADDRFEDRWARTDLPVAEGEVARTWIWAPSPYSEGMMEPYAEASGGTRLVQYFDKSRMELLNPEDEGNDLWDVTQGLLALDMLQGQIQVGDSLFAPHSAGPSTENVAGDPGPNNGPTYATMGELMDAEARAEGAAITDWLNEDGTIESDEDLAGYGVTAQYNINEDWIDHTIASVFWDFMNAEGTVWADGAYVEDLLFEDPFYAVGYPVSEAYWTNVEVKGESKDVLVQCFERRCLTYTPDNPENWMVEAGNVGQHYYRYLQAHQGPLTPYEAESEGLVQPRGVTEHDGALYVAEAGDGGDECIEIEEEIEGEIETFEVCAGLNGAVTKVEDGSQERVAEGLPSLDLGEDASGPHDVAFDDQGNMYVIIGMGGPPEARELFGETGELLGTIVRVDGPNDFEVIADLAQYEADENPEDSFLDTNPYSIAWDGENLIATDAGGNSLLRVGLDGSIETIATFESRLVPAPPFIPEDEIPMESVPTNVVIGPDGNYYVAELTGFPFPVGAARVYQVTPAGEVSTYADGLTNVSDLAFDSDGDLYALEMVAGGLLGADQEAVFVEGDFSSIVSRIVEIDEDGTQSVVPTSGLYFSTGLAVGDDDELYLAHLSVTPLAELVRIDQ